MAKTLHLPGPTARSQPELSDVLALTKQWEFRQEQECQVGYLQASRSSLWLGQESAPQVKSPNKVNVVDED